MDIITGEEAAQKNLFSFLNQISFFFFLFFFFFFFSVFPLEKGLQPSCTFSSSPSSSSSFAFYNLVGGRNPSHFPAQRNGQLDPGPSLNSPIRTQRHHLQQQQQPKKKMQLNASNLPYFFFFYCDGFSPRSFSPPPPKPDTLIKKIQWNPSLFFLILINSCARRFISHLNCC